MRMKNIQSKNIFSNKVKAGIYSKYEIDLSHINSTYVEWKGLRR